MANQVTPLSARVNYVPGTGRVKVATQVTILKGNIPVATGTLGGRYSQQQAVAEFGKRRKPFIVNEIGVMLKV